jgi:hypothetical protein
MISPSIKVIIFIDPATPRIIEKIYFVNSINEYNPSYATMSMTHKVIVTSEAFYRLINGTLKLMYP